MLLSITTTHAPATDLGYLLAKHPDKYQRFPLNHGAAHVFYPRAEPGVCTACLLLDIDPIGLVRGRQRQEGHESTLFPYVNDRPYVASSFFSVAIAQVLGSALRGQCKELPELARRAIPLEARVAVVPCRGGEPFLRRLFEPLGYRVSATRAPLDERFPEWGEGPYFTVDLSATTRLADLLTHLYVLLPVLDNAKHYWVGRDELDKLLARGQGWLAAHPERDEIVRRYLKHQRRLAREATERLREDPREASREASLDRLLADDDMDPAATDGAHAREEETLEEPISLNDQRIAAVLAELERAGARRVIDLGCGEGRLLARLVRNKQLERITGVDVSHRALEIARARLAPDGLIDRLPARLQERITLFQGSLTYRDERFSGYDAACAIEVVEHIDPSRLPAFERVLFALARPHTVIVTTPNRDYNARFANLPAGRLRHRDHRFEWTRDEFAAWARRVAAAHGYALRLAPIGPEHPDLGAPTQMGVFHR